MEIKKKQFSGRETDPRQARVETEGEREAKGSAFRRKDQKRKRDSLCNDRLKCLLFAFFEVNN